jgi:hypothetical protein
MNRDFEFKQLLRAYRAGIISEETFNHEMSELENGAGANGSRGFEAFGKNYGSEREAVAALLDRFRVGEANGEKAFKAWAQQCTTECVRSGIRMIAEREGYHARIFERRMADLGLKCEAQPAEMSVTITERLADANTPDNQKLLYLNSLAPNPETFLKPIADLAENIKEDLETKELLKLFVQDELSSAKWLQYACGALNAGAPAPAPSQKMSAESFMKA